MRIRLVIRCYPGVQRSGPCGALLLRSCDPDHTHADIAKQDDVFKDMLPAILLHLQNWTKGDESWSKSRTDNKYQFHGTVGFSDSCRICLLLMYGYTSKGRRSIRNEHVAQLALQHGPAAENTG